MWRCLNHFLEFFLLKLCFEENFHVFERKQKPVKCATLPTKPTNRHVNNFSEKHLNKMTQKSYKRRKFLGMIFISISTFYMQFVHFSCFKDNNCKGNPLLVILLLLCQFLVSDVLLFLVFLASFSLIFTAFTFQQSFKAYGFGDVDWFEWIRNFNYCIW